MPEPIRDRKRPPTTAEKSACRGSPAPSEPGAGSEARLLLGRLFGSHPESSRTIAVLHYLDGLTLEQVAEGWPVGVRRAKAPARLRHDLADLETP